MATVQFSFIREFQQCIIVQSVETNIPKSKDISLNHFADHQMLTKGNKMRKISILNNMLNRNLVYSVFFKNY